MRKIFIIEKRSNENEDKILTHQTVNTNSLKLKTIYSIMKLMEHGIVTHSQSHRFLDDSKTS